MAAARKPIYGADKIARFLVGVQRKPAFVHDTEYAVVRVNGDFGVRMVSPTAGSSPGSKRGARRRIRSR